MKILALDPGQSFGWALSNTATPDGDVELARYWIPNYRARIGNRIAICGAWQLQTTKDSGARFNLLHRLIASQKGLDSIILEAAPGLLGRASVWFNGYNATVALTAHELGVPFRAVNVSTWKKCILKDSRTSKHAIRAHAEKHYGISAAEPPSQDAIDALCVLAWGLEK